MDFRDTISSSVAVLGGTVAIAGGAALLVYAIAEPLRKRRLLGRAPSVKDAAEIDELFGRKLKVGNRSLPVQCKVEGTAQILSENNAQRSKVTGLPVALAEVKETKVTVNSYAGAKGKVVEEKSETTTDNVLESTWAVKLGDGTLVHVDTDGAQLDLATTCKSKMLTEKVLKDQSPCLVFGKLSVDKNGVYHMKKSTFCWHFISYRSCTEIRHKLLFKFIGWALLGTLAVLGGSYLVALAYYPSTEAIALGMDADFPTMLGNTDAPAPAVNANAAVPVVSL